MKSIDSAKVEFYRVTIYTAISLIEERTERKLHTLDANIERRLESSLQYGNIKELKALHSYLSDMYESVKKKALIA